MENENWKDVVGYEGNYQVSNLGFNQAHISKCCLGKIKSSYGFVWKYSENI